MTALSDPAAALTAVLIVAPLVAGMFIAYDAIKARWFDDEPDDIVLPSHVHVIPIGEQVRAAHRIQQDACIASGDHINLFDQDAERGAA